MTYYAHCNQSSLVNGTASKLDTIT